MSTLTLTLLEKAANRLIVLVRVRNISPDSRKYKTELLAMVNLLENMDFDIDFIWSDKYKDNKIVAITLQFDGVEVSRAA